MFSSLILFEPIVVDNSPISFLCMWVFSFPSPSGWKKTVLSLLGLAPLSKIIRPYVRRLISGLSVLFHWSVCLSVCQYTVVITVALWYVLKLGSVNFSALFSVFSTVLAICSPLGFHVNFRMGYFFISAKKMSLIFYRHCIKSAGHFG